MEYILSSYRKALTQRPFTWRHDKVFRKLAHHVELKRVNGDKSETKRANQITREFVKPGQPACNKTNTKHNGHSVGLLNRSTEWVLRVNLDKRLVFRFEIETGLRPDMLLYPSRNKLSIIIELTVHIELCDNRRDKRWSLWWHPLEVGCRRFVGTSTIRALRQIVLTGKERNNAINEMSDVTEKASGWLWLKRFESRWKPSS